MSTATVPHSGEDSPRRQPASRRRRWRLLLVATLVLGGSTYFVVDAATGSAGPRTPDAPAVETDTATVETRTLSRRLTLDGALGYAGSAELVGASSGTLTGVAAVGSTVTAGQALWHVDNVAVPLMSGALPQWRRFEVGMSDGDDVRQLEENLDRLGHDPDDDLTVDTHFTRATENAVKRWQKSIGREQTGIVELGHVVFYGTDVRVTQQLATVGSPASPGSPILEVSQTRRTVTVKLDARRQYLVAIGVSVQVTLPDGRAVAGTITGIGSVASKEGDGAATVDVTVDFDAGVELPALDQAPVDVVVDLESRTALAVPVKALLALAEGGYAVESVQDGRTELVEVTTGMFADGHVEISGNGVREGMTVTVPR